MEGQFKPLDFEGSTPPYDPDRKPKGCLFYGCLFSAIAGVIIAGMTGLGVHFAFRLARQFVKDYGEDSGRPVAVVDLPPAQVEEIRKRIETFQINIEAGKPTEPLVITANEINALIAQNPDFRGVVAIEIEGDKVRAQISFPLEKYWFPGKFLNGIATIKPRIEAGKLVITLETLSVRGKPIPESQMGSIRSYDLTKELGKNADYQAAISRIESIEVKDGKILIRSKGTPPQAPAPPESRPAAEPPPAPKVAAPA